MQIFENVCSTEEKWKNNKISRNVTIVEAVNKSTKRLALRANSYVSHVSIEACTVPVNPETLTTNYIPMRRFISNRRTLI